jgi:hypothetical protein
MSFICQSLEVPDDYFPLDLYSHVCQGFLTCYWLKLESSVVFTRRNSELSESVSLIVYLLALCLDIFAGVSLLALFQSLLSSSEF